MEKTVEINEKKYIIKELKYKDMAALADVPKEEASKKLIQLSTSITDEEYNELTLKEGIKLQTVINKLNGLDDFQKPLTP